MNFEYQNSKNKILNSLRLNPSVDRIEFYYPSERKTVVILERRKSEDFESDVIEFLANASMTHTIRDLDYSLVDFYCVKRPTFSFFLESSVADTNIDCETMEALLENIRRVD